MGFKDLRKERETPMEGLYDVIHALDHDVAEFIDSGLNDERLFNELAIREFTIQYNNLLPYKEYCLEKKVTPDNIQRWQDIPAVPSAAFKTHNLASFPLEKTVQQYLTSGTTGRRNRGRIYRDEGSLMLVKKANSLLTRTYLFPDIERMKIMLMAPSPDTAPVMGMAIGLELVRQMFGTTDSAFLVSPLGLDVETLIKAIKEAEETGEPLSLIGATSCFIYFFKACKQEGISFKLPSGSRCCDSGGYVGQFGNYTKEDFFEMGEQILGIPAHYWVNVLGTAECSTNYFDNVISNFQKGITAPRFKESPPWTRTIVVSPDTLEPVPNGTPGLLRHYDLTNRAMVLAVQTDNVGVAIDSGFEILGRWCKEKGGYVITYSGGHPAGRFFTNITDYLMTRKIASIGKYYNKIYGGRQS